MTTTIREARPMGTARACRGRTLRLIAIAVAVVATTPCGGKKPSPAGAPSVVAAGGTVLIQRGGRTMTATPGLRLEIGDVLSTGPDSRAEVSLSGGHVLRLGPASRGVVQRDSTVTAPLIFVLNEGSVETVTAPTGVRLVIGTPFGRADIANGSKVEVSSAGLVVHVGSIEVMFADGKTLTIPTGGRYPSDKAAGGRTVGKPSMGMVVKPLTFALTATSRQVQVKRAGETAWSASRSRETLGRGDALRTQKAENTRLKLDARTSAVLRPATEIIAKESGLTAEGSTAHLMLRSGGAKLWATRDDTGIGRHVVEVAGHLLQIEPGLEEAIVDVSADTAGDGEVVVHLGRAFLADGRTVEAGHALALSKRQSARAPAPLATTFVDLKAGRKVEVRCAGRVPPVRFVWEPGQAAPPFTLELARDERYTTKALREAVSQSSLTYGLLRPGTWFWRVRTGETWQTGSVAIEHDQDADSPNYKRQNLVEDTGRDTTVYFQETLPAILLRWTAVPGATEYRLRLYDDDSLDKPRIDQTVTGLDVSLPSGRLPEGKYAWSVQALAADHRPRLTGTVNRLTIAYDNAIWGLRIRSPRRGATTRGTSVLTKGEVALGGTLVINGIPAGLDRKGRFAEVVTLHKGFNHIVYHVPGSGNRDQYWIRDIFAD